MQSCPCSPCSAERRKGCGTLLGFLGTVWCPRALQGSCSPLQLSMVAPIRDTSCGMKCRTRRPTRGCQPTHRLGDRWVNSDPSPFATGRGSRTDWSKSFSVAATESIWKKRLCCFHKKRRLPRRAKFASPAATQGIKKKKVRYARVFSKPEEFLETANSGKKICSSDVGCS